VLGFPTDKVGGTGIGNRSVLGWSIRLDIFPASRRGSKPAEGRSISFIAKVESFEVFEAGCLGKMSFVFVFVFTAEGDEELLLELPLTR
jgi:hypothetical protein